MMTRLEGRKLFEENLFPWDGSEKMMKKEEGGEDIFLILKDKRLEASFWN